MEKDKAIIILYFYKTIDKEIELNNRIIQDLEEQYYSLSGGAMDGLPKGKNKKSNPTEAIAFNIPYSASITMREMVAKNKQLCTLKTEILREMNRLPFIHRKIIHEFYIQGLHWVQISKRTNYSERHCKNIRCSALEKIVKQFDVNKAISDYEYPQ